MTVARCELTQAGLRQPLPALGSASAAVAYACGEVVLMLSDPRQGAVDVSMHPDDAQHLVERLRVAIGIARQMADETDTTPRVPRVEHPRAPHLPG